MIRGLLKNRLFLGFFVVPLCATAFYLYFIASDVYESEAKFIIRQENQAKTPFFDIGLLTSGTSASMMDSLLLQQLIESMGMLQYLEEHLDIHGHYSDKSYDFIARLNSDASREEYFDYYLNRVEIIVDQMSSVADIKVKAFSPEMAQSILNAILKRGDIFANEIGHNLAREQMVFIREELAAAEEKLNEASDNLLLVQNEYKLFSPEAEALSMGQIITGLETELAMQRTELKNLESFLNPQATEIITAKSRIKALQAQVKSERQKQTGKNRASDDPALNSIALRFERAQQDFKLAVAGYESALNALDNARVDASRKMKHLVIVSPPTLADEARYPRRIYILTTLFAVLLLLFGIARLTIATIEDHRE